MAKRREFSTPPRRHRRDRKLAQLRREDHGLVPQLEPVEVPARAETEVAPREADDVRLRGASRFGPNSLNIQKETTPGIVRWPRVHPRK